MRPAHRPAIAAAALAAGLLLAGCANLGEPPAAAAPPVAVGTASAWQAPLPHGGRTADLARWWQQFDDPLLAELVEAAQVASPTLAAARTRIARARATLAAAGARALPAVDAVGSATQARSAPGTPTVASAGLGVQASWELDLFGGVAADRRAAGERLRGAEAGWHDARIALAADVAGAYLALRACEAQLEQVRVDVASREASAALTEQSARAGFTAPADAALVRAGAAQARGQALSQRALCDAQVLGLVELTDRPAPALRAQLAAATARLPLPPAIAPAALPGELLQQRPDLAAAAAAVAAAAADVAQARADERPRISIGGSLAASAVRTAGIGTSGPTWSLGPLAVSFPVFDAGRRAAATAASLAAYDEAVATWQATARRAWREVEGALLTLDSTAARERDALTAAADFEAALAATQARQRGGLASLLDLEVARRNAVQAQVALIDLRRERAAAWVALYRSLGGGWTPGQPVPAAAR